MDFRICQNKIIFLLLVAAFSLFVIALNAEAGYDTSLNDPEDDVWDRDNEQTTTDHPEIDILSIITTKTGDTEVTVDMNFKGDIATSGSYFYGVEVSDGEEDSEHWARLSYSPAYGVNQIEYQNGDEDETVGGGVTISGKKMSGIVNLTKCGIPEGSFTINNSFGVLLDGAEWEYGDDAPDGSNDLNGEGGATEGYKSKVEVIEANADKHVNDIKVTVEYEDGEDRARTAVEGAEVTVGYDIEGQEELWSGTTDASGIVQFENFIPGEYKVVIEDDTHEDYEEWFFIEILLDGNEILKVMADSASIEEDDVEDDGEVWVYYGTMYDMNLVNGADVYMDGIYQGQTEGWFFEIQGPLAEGHHFVRVEFGDDVAYDDFWIWYFYEDSHEEDLEFDLSDDDGDGKVNDLNLQFEQESGPSSPIPDVDVYLDGEKIGTTDANGEVYHKDISEGYHEITLTYDGDDYFEYLLIGITQTHEIGDFDFDGDANDMQFDVAIGGFPLPYTMVGYHLGDEEIIGGGFTSFDGIGYIQDIEAGAYSAMVGNWAFDFNQTTEFDFDVGAGPAKLHVATDVPTTLDSDEVATVTVTVTGSGGIEGVSVTIEKDGPVTIDPTSGTTDANGELTFTITADNITSEDAIFTIWINATKTDYEGGKYAKSISITAWIPPEEEITKPQQVDLGDGNYANVTAGIVGNVTLSATAGIKPDDSDPDSLGVYLNVTKSGDGTLNWVNITIDYDSIPTGIDPSKLKMYYWNETGQKWELVQNSGVDTVNKRVWANVTHLTLFAPRQQTETGEPNQAPVVTILTPATGDNESGVVSITWTAVDPDGDNMMYTIKLSDDSGVTWTDLKVNLHSLVQLKYDWDTNFSDTYPNGNLYRIKVIASDDDGVEIMSGSDETGDFTVYNAPSIPDDPGPTDGDDDDDDDDSGIAGFEVLVTMISLLGTAGLLNRKRRS